MPPKPPTQPTPHAPVQVDTLPALQLAQQHIESEDLALRSSAETLMSYLVFRLRHPTCVIPGGAVPALRRLMNQPSTK